ncbi:MAG: hypothetical protein E3J58_00245 [Actinomycetota bacterium]|nr:MAG: hypothetical protein E3J58_00245 [Actinomycetota bacterium]
MQKITMAIPTYWSPPEGTDLREDRVFDHPIPLDQEGTLGRALESLCVLNRSDFSVVLIVASTLDSIENEVINRVEEICKPFNGKIDISLVHQGNLKNLKEKLLNNNVPLDACALINLDNYSSVRNMCSLAGILNSSELVIFIDDDEVFADSKFIDKAVEFVGTEIKGEKILAVAGYYINSDGNYRLDETNVPLWKKEHWNNVLAMNQAFDQTIGKSPRLKPTPFVFGGNMVIHRELLANIAFDPAITRGEDIDFLINTRISGMKFWLDNTLSIIHLPPSKKNPQWLSFREDIKRFLYEKKKVSDHSCLDEVSRDELMPYPGLFLGEDLEEKILAANKLLYRDYKEAGDRSGMEQCNINEEIVKSESFKDIDTRKWLLELRSNWKVLTNAAAGIGIPE